MTSEPTWDDLMSDYVQRPKRPTPRHRAENRLWGRAAAALATARQEARDALRDALVGSGTPAGGLALLVDLQRSQGRES